MNDVETTPELVQVDPTLVPVAPEGDGEAAQPEATVFVAEEPEAVSVPFDA